MKIKIFIQIFLFFLGIIFSVFSQVNIILLNGASCSGKSTTAKALGKKLRSKKFNVAFAGIDEYYLLKRYDSASWDERYETFRKKSPFRIDSLDFMYDVLNQEIATLAKFYKSGFLIVDYCSDEDFGFCNLLMRLKSFKIFFIKIYCTYEKACERLVFRNTLGGDEERAPHIVDLHFGIKDNFECLKNRASFPTIHDHKIYDLEVDTTEKPTSECVAEIMSILDTEPHAFEQNFSDVYWIEKIKKFYSQEIIKSLW